MKKGK
jgi:hypothetical protein